MSNNNVIYSKTLELRSNNRGTVPLKASEVLEIKWEGGEGIDQQRAGGEKGTSESYGDLGFHFIA